MSSEYIKVVTVTPRENYQLDVTLSNGKTGVFDLAPYLDSGVFRKLRDRDYFLQVRTLHGSSGIGWPGGLTAPDLSADTLDAELKPATP